MNQTQTAADFAASNAPAIGDGATIHSYTDSAAATVIAVSASGVVVTLQRDKSTLLNGHNSGAADALRMDLGGFCGHTSGEQRYSYERDPNGEIEKFSRRVVNGKIRWVKVGETSKGGQRATLSGRFAHYDYNF